MKKILKFGLGIVAGAATAHVVYHGYKSMEENLLRELTDTARQHFSDEKIDAVWIFEDPDHGAYFKGGIVNGNKAISFEINAETLEISSEKNTKIKLT
ncbi:hypothetical protein [Lactococcus protaetiae]|uniref:PepSY domain-containing protein n=1 Tax=Lactococcus protaetiae TaxID=2592653 RepID=A0A514Z7Q2_9LACT|nr:hypothetical protein [Lactococcus protaetiae]MCL2113669.1 hypothetical protein [Streptococcaceae bacterium]QDK70616.1 hypothetical protein FLP15_04830 [Lactococcus protaetiae]